MADFKDIIGQEHIKRNLLTSILNNKISHAYIFTGEAGSGRHILADAFSKTLLCTGNTALKEEIRATSVSPNPDRRSIFKLDACDICRSCIQMDSCNNPDMVYITPEKNTISVETIREKVNFLVDIKPYSGKYKIFVISDADSMTEAAQNALLKTIEEPPEYVVIILISNNTSMLLPTIVSRCVTLTTRPLDKSAIADYLQHTFQMEKGSAEIAANFCQGNVGKAIHFATSEHFVEVKTSVLSLVKRIDKLPLTDIIEIIRSYALNSSGIDDYLDLMLLWYRDILMFKVTKDANLLLYKDEYAAISEQASKRGYEEIEHIIDGISTAKLRLKANVNFDTTIDLMLLNIKDGCK